MAVGLGSPGEGYRIVRHAAVFSHINVCLQGAGRILHGGRWVDYQEGMAALLPRQVLHGAEWAGSPWRMCWVLYREPPGKAPLIRGSTVELIRVAPRPFEWALFGLYEEINGASSPAIVERWVDLLHAQILRAAQPAPSMSRLAPVWAQVDADLAHPWTAAKLARRAHMSEAHLRRLTAAELGRSPLQQVAWLRIQRAARLLESRAQTVEASAWAVGYQSVSAFTTAFKRHYGRLPRKSG